MPPTDPSEDRPVTRRQLLAASVAGLAATALAEPSDAATAARPHARMPVVYLPHGGGPWPFVEMGLDRNELASLAQYLRGLRQLPKTPPAAILAVSAHWEMPQPTVMTHARPPMLYDYYGFPPESYKVTWPAPGHPQLAAKVAALLQAAGIACGSDPDRGFDHGTFVPLKLTYPDADVPTVQLSLKRGLDPAEHIAIGRALQPLRDQGVFVVCSGMSYHNMRGFGQPLGKQAAQAFDGWLGQTSRLAAAERDQKLLQWQAAPAARLAHPREEHLLPLMVAAGAAGNDVGRIGWNGTVFGMAVSAVHFG